MHFFFSDLESGRLFDPPVEALSGLGGGQEVVPLRHDPPLQQQQRKQENSSSGMFVLKIILSYKQINAQLSVLFYFDHINITFDNVLYTKYVKYIHNKWLILWK